MPNYRNVEMNTVSPMLRVLCHQFVSMNRISPGLRVHSTNPAC